MGSGDTSSFPAGMVDQWMDELLPLAFTATGGVLTLPEMDRFGRLFLLLDDWMVRGQLPPARWRTDFEERR